MVLIRLRKATAEIRGYDSKAADGKSVTTDDLNKDNKIYVGLDIAGSNEIKYQLKDGDYAWYDDEQNNIQDPTEVGTYHLELTDQGKDSVTKFVDAIAGEGAKLVDGKEKVLPNTKVDLGKTSVTYIIYNDQQNKTQNLPKETTWTPAGWTRSNPDHVAKQATMALHNNGENNFKKPLTQIGKDKFVATTFGTEIVATIDRNDLQIGNKILLGTIISTNDYATTPDEELPLVAVSSID